MKLIKKSILEHIFFKCIFLVCCLSLYFLSEFVFVFSMSIYNLHCCFISVIYELETFSTLVYVFLIFSNFESVKLFFLLSYSFLKLLYQNSSFKISYNKKEQNVFDQIKTTQMDFNKKISVHIIFCQILLMFHDSLVIYAQNEKSYDKKKKTIFHIENYNIF